MKTHIRRQHHSKTFYKYAVSYFFVILLLSAGILSTAMFYARRRLIDVQTENARISLQQAADELANQFGTLSDIANIIGTDAKYLPVMVQRDRYYDIQLLDEFKRFRNYSPISKTYFLAYDFMEKVYTSDGFSSYFPHLAAAEYGMSADEADSMHTAIVNAASVCVLPFREYLFAVFPVTFYGSTPSAGRGAMCFVLTRQRLNNYLEKASYHLPDEFRIELDGTTALDTCAREYEDGELLSVEAGGLIRISAPVRLEGWQLLFTQNLTVTILETLGVLALAFVIACLLARHTLKPINALIEKYTPERERIENEFLHLDSILSHMRALNSSSREQLQNLLLESILRGYYSDEMLERWSMLGIHFERGNLCVYVVDAANPDEAARARITKRLNAVTHPQVRLYAAVMHEDRRLVVIADYAPALTSADAAGLIEEALAPEPVEIYAGRPCDTPKRLPISYMEALTAQSVNAPRVSETETRMRALANELLVAVKSGNEESLSRIMDAAKHDLCENGETLFMSKYNVYVLLSEVAVAASQYDYVLDTAKLNALVLLPDAETVLTELKAMLTGGMQKAADSLKTHNDLSRPIVEYVIANAFNPDFDLNMISDRFALSNDYISTLIKKETGSAFKEYLTMIRIGEARRLLASEKSLSVAEVAERVGYRKTSNFSRKFRELTGMLPSEYR